MIQSQQVLEWQAEARAEGRAEGRTEGRAEGRADAILRVLEVRHGPLPESLPPRARAIRDVAQLDGLLVTAARCASLDEFLAALPASS
jgi:predicted transposase YdaD